MSLDNGRKPEDTEGPHTETGKNWCKQKPRSNVWVLTTTPPCLMMLDVRIILFYGLIFNPCQPSYFSVYGWIEPFAAVVCKVCCRGFFINPSIVVRFPLMLPCNPAAIFHKNTHKMLEIGLQYSGCNNHKTTQWGSVGTDKLQTVCSKKLG